MKHAIMLILAAIGIMITANVPVEAREVPFTLEDRDRNIRTEAKVDALEKKVDALNQSVNLRIDSVNLRIDSVNLRIDDLMADMNKRFEQVDKRLDHITTFMFWGFGMLFGAMGLLMGFIIWDRRTALAPAIQKTKEIEKRAELPEKAFRELARKNHDVKEVLKHIGLS
ncbi:MAG: hypothetical protein HQK89_18375 [Nitrospirae bacterium]|nr:hypothetical protein [Nitrospirota bacterium]